MEKSYLITIRELRRVYNARRSHSKKNKIILKKMIEDIAEIVAKAHVEISKNRGLEGQSKEFLSSIKCNNKK